MTGLRFIVGGLCGAMLSAMPVLAQTRPSTPAPGSPNADTTLRAPSRPDAGPQARHQIFVMESVLEQAVQLGAQMLSDRLRTAGMPDMVLLAGAARARGYRLDGYGVFFDLEVPAVRRSVAWSLRMMDRPDPRLAQAVTALRRQVQALRDPDVKANFDALIRQLEAEVAPQSGFVRQANPDVRDGTVSAATIGAEILPEPPGASQLDEPGEVYTNEVRKALIDAMFDHSGPMNLAAGDWLTVAARADVDRRFLSGDPNDMPPTMMLRVRGADLVAFREGRLSREEAVKRVEVHNF